MSLPVNPWQFVKPSAASAPTLSSKVCSGVREATHSQQRCLAPLKVCCQLRSPALERAWILLVLMKLCFCLRFTSPMMSNVSGITGLVKTYCGLPLDRPPVDRIASSESKASTAAAAAAAALGAFSLLHAPTASPICQSSALLRRLEVLLWAVCNSQAQTGKTNCFDSCH